MTWDDIPDLATDPELGPLVTLTVDDETAIIAFYATEAAKLQPLRPPVVAIADLPASHPLGGAGYLRASHQIDLNPREGASEADVTAGRWRGLLHGQFWHEMAHALDSYEPTEPDPLDELIAQQLLEDVRIEREVVKQQRHARRWLRANTLGRYATVPRIRALAAQASWRHVYCVLCARRHAGVVTEAEAAEIAEMEPDENERFQRIDAIFAAYVALDPATEEAARLVRALSLELPPG